MMSSRESEHLVSRVAGWIGVGATYVGWLAMWAVTVASPLLALVAGGLWPWGLIPLGLTVGYTLVKLRRWPPARASESGASQGEGDIGRRLSKTAVVALGLGGAGLGGNRR